MPTDGTKAAIAARDGAHVAAVLHRILIMEEFKDLDHRSDVAKHTLEDLMAYTDRLKKPEDQKAVKEFCARRYHRHLAMAGYDVEIDATAERLIN